MQPNDNMTVQRRALDVEDYIDVLRRHKGWIFGPFLFCLVASVVGVFLWPDSYESVAVVRVKQQQIPESMVASAINQRIYDRIQSIQQSIESRAVLTSMINDFGLYQRERNRMPIEDVIDMMKKSIGVKMLQTDTTSATRTIPAFAVEFSYEDRHKAQQVVQNLVTRFIDEDLRSQSTITFETTKFMQDELDQSKKALDEVETKLAAFRAQHAGQLPDQLSSNMQSLSALQSQVTMFEAAISRINQEKLQLENSLRIIRDQENELKKTPPEKDQAVAAHRNEKLVEAERDVQAAEDTLRVLRQRYSDTYPDVKAMEGRLKIAQDKRDALLKEEADQQKAETAKAGKEAAAPKPLNPTVQREIRNLEANAQQIQGVIETKDMEIGDANKAIRRASEMIKTYTAHLENIPLGEKEYDDLLREQTIRKEEYVSLQDRLQKAQLSQEMQARNEGERLEILDPPTLPQTPNQPNRPVVIAIGAGIGLLLGMVVAGGREMKDTALKNLKDVRAYTQMAILGSIPLLENDFVVRRRKRLAWLGWTTACLAAVVIMSGSIVYYFTTYRE